MNAHKVGWFTELSSLWPGQAFSLEVEEILVDLKSNYQHIFIFKSKTYGTCLALDGILQCTERDEFSYQEMITHLALFCHPEPKKVLVIGGGDGCVVREVLKHQYVESVTLCEIDRKVVELCKQHLPFSSSSLDHPKCHIHIGDGLKFMEQHQNEFDVIITDSSDPFGPAVTLFKEEYYRLMHSALRSNGITISQGECAWLHLNLIKSMNSFCKQIFPSVAYAYTSVPTYPSGQIGFILCSKDASINFKAPKTGTLKILEEMNLKYYNQEVHTAAFALPQFLKNALF